MKNIHRVCLLMILLVSTCQMSAFAGNDHSGTGIGITCVPPSITTQALVSQAICKNATPNSLTITAEGDGLTYQWYSNTINSSTGGIIIVGQTTASYIPPSSIVGTVYYYVQVTGDCGQLSSNTSAVVVNELSVSVGAVNPTCPGCVDGKAFVNASGGTTPYTYAWTNNIVPGTVNIVASRDNSIFEETMVNSNGLGEFFVAGTTAAGFINRALLRFDIATNIPAGANITNASLQLSLTHTSGISGPKAHSLHKLLQDWGEGTSNAGLNPGRGAPATAGDATWLRTFYPNSNWNTAGGSFTSAASASTIVDQADLYTWSSTAMVSDIQSWFDAPATNFGWLLKSDETGNRQAKRYGSRENPTASDRPLLSVSYGPGIIGNSDSITGLAHGTYMITVTDAAGCAVTTNVTIAPAFALPSIISQDFLCNSDTAWFIDGKVYVHNNATLFIGPGTVIKAMKKTAPGETSILVITRNGRIDCQGTNVNPVAFTSAAACPQAGDWGGIVLLGAAPLNRTDTSVAGIDILSSPPGIDVQYGGGVAGSGNPDHSNGVIRYTRIEYAGATFGTDVALNDREYSGLVCAGVGRGTELDFIQVSHSGDDAFAFPGGTVNARHLVAFAPHDDALDFTFGYNGYVQFVVSKESTGKAFYGEHPNGIESDNNYINSLSTPRTNATITNMTVIGMEDSLSASEYLPAPGSKRLLYGARLRNSSSHTIRNSILMGFPTGVRFESAASIADAEKFQHNIVHGFRVVDLGAAIDVTNTEITGDIFNSNATIKLTDPFNGMLPDFRPSGLSPASTGASFTGLNSLPASFFQPVTYRGAFNPAQLWTATWTRFF